MKQKIITLFCVLSLVLLPTAINADEQQFSELSSEISMQKKCAVCSADINIDTDTLGLQQTRGCKIKSLCNICASTLAVGLLAISGSLTVNGTFLDNGTDLSSPAAIGAALATAGVTIPGTGLGYGYIFALTQPASVAIGAPILFDTNGPLLGVTHTPSSPTIAIVAAGTYSIRFSVSGAEPNQFGIAFNGNIAADSASIYGAGAGAAQNFGQTIYTLAAGTTIQIMNYSSPSAVTLAQQGGTASNVYASVIINRLA
jgi:hypothetical protein